MSRTAGPRELISAEEYAALTDIYLLHPVGCGCQDCARMDALQQEMCVEPGCRNAEAPGSWGCELHPEHRRRRRATGTRGRRRDA